jgi:hypothetical protein
MQWVEVTGVVDDGPRGVDVPRSTATTIQVPRAGDATIRVQVLRASGRPYELPAGWEAWLTVRRTAYPCPDEAPLLRKSGQGDVGSSVVRFELAAKSTSSLAPARYFFDVWLTAEGRRWHIVAVSALVLAPSLA